MKTEDKPRIVRILVIALGGPFVAWHCSDARNYAVGLSPKDAYETWARYTLTSSETP